MDLDLNRHSILPVMGPGENRELQGLGSSWLADESRFSRQILALGRDSMEQLARSTVLVYGLRGVGAEVAKNLVMTGVKAVHLADDCEVAEEDLAAQFLLRRSDVGAKSRAAASAARLREINPHCQVEVVPTPLVPEALARVDVLVATHGSYKELVELNNGCRRQGAAAAATRPAVKFVAALSRGMCAGLFVDLGPAFQFHNPTGEPAGTLMVESITQDCPAVVSVAEDHRHGMADGDAVTFSGIRGMEELNSIEPLAVTVTGPSSFTIPVDSRKFGPYTLGGYIAKVPQPFSRPFQPLERQLERPTFGPEFDPAQPARSRQLHAAFRAVDRFLESHPGGEAGRAALTEEESARLAALAEALYAEESGAPEPRAHAAANGSARSAKSANGAVPMDHESAADGAEGVAPHADDSGAGLRPGLERIVTAVAQGALVEVSPVTAIAGSIAAQEVMKACTGQLTPLHQFLYLDFLDCLPASMVRAETPEGRSLGPLALFGQDFAERLAALKWLVVGAGAVGCEVLKNLGLLGVGTAPGGALMVADADGAKRPNLATQLLLRAPDVGRNKAAAAAKRLREMNPDLTVHAIEEPVDADHEATFSTSYFQGLDGVMSCVDSSAARLYLDTRCVFARKPMIDGGKHGTKGSVQVFVPYESEMYASTRDPPEHKEYPICTVRNFPYAPEHTFQWAMDMFGLLFAQRARDVNLYLGDRGYGDQMRKQLPSAVLPALAELKDALLTHRPLGFEACIEWARLQFEELFCNNIKQLTYNFPPDMATSTGLPFWSGTKRCPAPLVFDARDPLHIDFVVAAANLQATMYGLRGCADRAAFTPVLHNMTVPAFKPKEGVKIAVSDSELRGAGGPAARLAGGGGGGGAAVEDGEALAACEQILEELRSPASLVGYRLTPIDFDPDNEESFAAEFVAAAANLRALNYGIPVSDPLQAKLSAGKVVPALVTTAAMVGGLMTVELLKLVLKAPLQSHSHFYFNLALPLFVRAAPVPAIKNKVATNHGTELVWTLWDRFEMYGAGMTLEKFIEEFKQQHGLEITMVSHGKSLLYAEFLHKKKLQERMPMLLPTLVTTVAKTALAAEESQLVFSVTCTDAQGEDVEVPDVVVTIAS